MTKAHIDTAVLEAIAQARKKVKERKKQGANRFMNNSAQAKTRRKDRETKRRNRGKQSTRGSGAPPTTRVGRSTTSAMKTRKRKPSQSGVSSPAQVEKEKRVGNRAGCLPCCGRRPERCKCWCEASASEEDRKVIAMLKSSRLKTIIMQIGKAQILTYKDTADLPHFLRSFPKDRHAPMHYKWGIAMFWRAFNNPDFWSCLSKCGAIPLNKEPRWHIVQEVLAAYEKAGAPSHSGLFRTTMLREYRNATNEHFTCVRHLASAARETLAYKTMWLALPKKELKAFAQQPTRATFKIALESFQHRLYGKEGLTKGRFNDYAVKCMLDGLLVNNTVSRHVLSSWPMQCPAYKTELRVLFPGIKPAQFCRAACYMNRLIYAKHHLHLAESLAHLCWIKRNVN